MPPAGRLTEERVVLFVPSFNHTLESLLPVARALRARNLRPVFVVDWAEAAPAARMCEEAAVDRVAVGAAAGGSGEVSVARRVAANLLPARSRGGFLWQLRQVALGLRRTVLHVQRCRERAAVSRELFDRFEPAAVVASAVRTQGLGAFMVREANRRGVPSVLAPQERIRGRDVLLNQRIRVNRTVERAPLYQKLLLPVAEAAAPGLVQLHEGQRAMFVPPEKAIIGRLFRVWPEDPWTRGRTRITRYAVQSEAYRRLAESEGVPADRLVVVGYPPYDELHHILQAGPEEIRSIRRRIESELGLDTGRRLVLFAGAATDQYVHLGGYADRDTYQRDIVLLIESILRLDRNAVVVYKAHPRDQVQDWEFLDGLPRTVVTRDLDMNELVLGCDLFVTSLSSTLFRAVALDKPVITYDFYENQVFDDLVGGYPGHRSVRERSQVEPVIGKVLADPHEQAVLSREREVFRREFANITGDAAERMGDLILELTSDDAVWRRRA